MTVLLINPSWNTLVSKKTHLYNWEFPPLDLLNVSAILKTKGLNSKILDLRVRPLSPEEIRRECCAADRIILTTSPLDRWQCPNIDLTPVFALTRLIQDKRKLIITGVHGSIFPEYILKHTGAYLLIRGEPEQTVSEIFDGIPPSDIHGLSYVEGKRVISTPDRELLDLDTLPLPDYEAVKIEDYRYTFLGPRNAMLQFSRGCPYHCIFCLKKMYGAGFRRKSPERFLQEIDYVINTIGARSIYFYDLSFTAHKPSVYQICEAIRQRGYQFSWCCQTRAEMLEPELLAAMKAAGCRVIHVGVESGSERIAGTLGKRVNLSQIRQGVQEIKEAGMLTACFFMFGLPGETRDDMEDTIKLALELDPDYATFHIAIPYAGTHFYELAEPQERYPAMYTKEIPERILRHTLRKAFLRFYLRPRYIVKTLLQRPGEWLMKLWLFVNYLR